MTALPARYRWLADEGGPRLLMTGLATYGVAEFPGRPSNPILMSWAQEVGLQSTYSDDSVPWCGLWMAVVAKRADWPVADRPLWARSWARWGEHADRASLGDILVFERGAGGHVGLYVAEDATHYHVLGGNQGDRVSIVRIAKRRLLAARHPVWRLVPPLSRRPVTMAAGGPVSTNEE